MAQGYKDTIGGTDTIHFIEWHKIPMYNKIRYGRLVCGKPPFKDDIYRTRLTVGGYQLPYIGIVSTPTANLTTIKVHINSTISTPGARYAVCDIKNIYLGTPMDDHEYMMLP